MTACKPGGSDPGELQAWCQVDAGNRINAGEEVDPVWAETTLIRLHPAGSGMAIVTRYDWDSQTLADTAWFDSFSLDGPRLTPTDLETRLAPLRWTRADDIYEVQLPGEPVWRCIESGTELICSFEDGAGQTTTRTYTRTPRPGIPCATATP